MTGPAFVNIMKSKCRLAVNTGTIADTCQHKKSTMPIATPPTERNKTRAIDLFTNREQPQQLFEEARAGLALDQYRILVFYGVGGQGKTLLCEKLRLNLQHEQPHRAVWGLLDLYPVDFREAAHGLLQLRKSLGESGRIKFTAFDYAIATYWEKAYPTEDIEVALQGIIAQNEDTLTSVAENAPGWLGETVEGGVIGIGFKVLKKLWKKLAKEQAEKAYPALVGLQQREQWEILHDLPMFFGWDLRTHRQGKNALQPIIFNDTYEDLWADKQTKTGLGATRNRRLAAAAGGRIARCVVCHLRTRQADVGRTLSPRRLGCVFEQSASARRFV